MYLTLAAFFVSLLFPSGILSFFPHNSSATDWMCFTFSLTSYSSGMFFTARILVSLLIILCWSLSCDHLHFHMITSNSWFLQSFQNPSTISSALGHQYIRNFVLTSTVSRWNCTVIQRNNACEVSTDAKCQKKTISVFDGGTFYIVHVYWNTRKSPSGAHITVLLYSANMENLISYLLKRSSLGCSYLWLKRNSFIAFVLVLETFGCRKTLPGISMKYCCIS